MKSILAATALAAVAADPQSLDCPLRQVALDFAENLQPWRPASAFQEVADALNGAIEAQGCAVKSSRAARALRGGDAAERRVQDFPLPGAGTRTYFVSPAVAAGGDGSQGRPFASVHDALAAVRADRAANGGRVEPAAIVLRAGTHFLRETLQLGAADSQLAFQAYPGEDAVMSGSVPVTGVTWTPWTPAARPAYEWRPGGPGEGSFSLEVSTHPTVADAQARCAALGNVCAGFTYNSSDPAPSTSMAYDFKYALFYVPGVSGQSVHVRYVGYGAGEKTNVWVADVSGLGLKHPVEGLRVGPSRGIRARYPNAVSAEELGAMQIKANSWTQQPMGTNAEYTYNPSFPLRNDSTQGYFQTFRIGVGGPCAFRFTPQASYWCSDNSQGGGPGPYQAPVGMTVTAAASSLPHTPYSNNAAGAVVHSWRAGRWFSWAFEVEDSAYDGATNTTFFEFSLSRGGNQGSRGGNAGQEFMIENVLDELDAPGEWFHDPAAGKLYLWYNGTGAPPTDGTVQVTQLAVLVNATGTQAAPVAGLSYLGLTFADSAPHFLAPHGTPSGGDWAVARMGALFVEGSVGLNVSGSLFTRIDGNAVFVSGYARNATISNNEFVGIGETAVSQWGYTDGSPVPGMGWDARAGNQPRGTVVSGNLAHEVGLYMKQNSFYFQSESFGNTITGNIAYNGPRAGVNFDDGLGGGSLLARNLVFNMCRESSDHGPFNSWNRVVYLFDGPDGQATVQKLNDTITSSLLWANYHSSMSVDNDDGSANYDTHHNVLVYKSSSAAYGGNSLKSDFGGHSNYHHHNLDLFYSQGFGIVSQLPGYEDGYYNNWLYTTSNGGDYGGGQTCSGGAATIVHDNTIWTPPGAKGVTECGKPLAQWQAQGGDPGTTVATWPDDSVVIAQARQLLGLTA